MHMFLAANPFFTSYQHSDFFGKGIFWILFLLSALSWCVLIYKIWLTVKIRRLSKEFEEGFEKKKDRPFSLSFVEPQGVPHPFQDLYRVTKEKTVEILEKNRFFTEREEEKKIFLSEADLDMIGSHLESTISTQSKFLRKYLFVLPTIMSLAPFMGLLGTVWGILLTMSELHVRTLTGANQAVLSGISMALATTVVGLIVAIPALIAYYYLKSATFDLMKDMENFSQRLLTVIEMQYRKVDVS